MRSGRDLPSGVRGRNEGSGRGPPVPKAYFFTLSDLSHSCIAARSARSTPGGRPPGAATHLITTAPGSIRGLFFLSADLAVVDKPAGVPAQATLTGDHGTLPELVSDLLGAPVALVHRLDRETSGVTVFARSRQAAAVLAEAFRTGEPAKTYLPLCARAPSPPAGRIDAPLAKDPRHPGRRVVAPGGEPAATRYRTISSTKLAALVEARPETGRTHQIGAHLAHLGAPLLGDPR